MANTLNTNDTFGSQSLLPISEIRNNVVILKNGALRSIIEVKGINLTLLPDEEQESAVYSWQAVLNNLEFSLEIVSTSRKVNIEQYVNKISEDTKKETNELLKYQINDYVGFISDFVRNYPIMKKHFYIVVPYDPVSLKPSSLFSQIKGALSRSLSLNREAFPLEAVMPEEEFQRNYQQLMIRQDTILTHLKRMGLESEIVPTDDLIQLYYNLYNPDNIDNKIIT